MRSKTNTFFFSFIWARRLSYLNINFLFSFPATLISFSFPPLTIWYIECFFLNFLRSPTILVSELCNRCGAVSWLSYHTVFFIRTAGIVDNIRVRLATCIVMMCASGFCLVLDANLLCNIAHAGTLVVVDGSGNCTNFLHTCSHLPRFYRISHQFTAHFLSSFAHFQA